MAHLRTKLAKYEVDDVEFGLVDCAPAAANALPGWLSADLDLLWVDMVTGATSAAIAPIFRSFSDPIVLGALQPISAMDYACATPRMQLFNDDVCSVQKFTGVAIRFGRGPRPVVIRNRGEDREAERELAEWCSFAHVLHDPRRTCIGGSFAGFHLMDFERGAILLGHDGPHHLKAADRTPVLRSLRKCRGKPGAGGQRRVQHPHRPHQDLEHRGHRRGRLNFEMAEGDSLQWPIPSTGNTNTHERFSPYLRTFLCCWVAEEPTYCFAVGVGHRARSLVHLAELLNIEHALVASWEA